MKRFRFFFNAIILSIIISSLISGCGITDKMVQKVASKQIEEAESKGIEKGKEQAQNTIDEANKLANEAKENADKARADAEKARADTQELKRDTEEKMAEFGKKPKELFYTILRAAAGLLLVILASIVIRKLIKHLKRN